MDDAKLSHPAVLDRARLVPTLAVLRESGKQIVFTNGCFDILHPGHVDLLDRARALGDVLVLGLNSDASVKLQGKGDDRPLNSFAARAFVLAHLRAVDFVVGFEEATPLELIRLIRPHVLVKGGDWLPEHIVGRDVVEPGGGRVISLSLLDRYSTTALIKKIRAAQGEDLCANPES